MKVVRTSQFVKVFRFVKGRQSLRCHDADIRIVVLQKPLQFFSITHGRPLVLNRVPAQSPHSVTKFRIVAQPRPYSCQASDVAGARINGITRRITLMWERLGILIASQLFRLSGQFAGHSGSSVQSLTHRQLLPGFKFY